MTEDDEDTLRYDRMVESALRGVVREAVQEVIEIGELPEDHHFYITFMTDYPGVKIPAYLHDRYPGEMTIVLQYQFYDLFVDDEKMGVTLSFNNVPERLEIPLAAITIFADPSVNFALQFGIAVIAEASLSYLGLGAPPPNASWGRLLQEAQGTVYAAPIAAVAPGIALVSLVIGVNLLADGLRDFADPTRRSA